MTEREKIAQIVAEHLCPQGKNHMRLYGADRRCYSRNNFAECAKVSNCVDALIEAGIRDITNKGHICMNGEVIAPTPEIYNKVAEFLDCPRLDCSEDAQMQSETEEIGEEVLIRALINMAKKYIDAAVKRPFTPYIKGGWVTDISSDEGRYGFAVVFAAEVIQNAKRELIKEAEEQ